MKRLAASLVALVFALAAMAAEEEADAASMPPTPPSDEPSGLTWGQVWGLLAGIGAGAGGGAWLTRRTIARIDPQPLEVTAHKEYVTRSEFDEYRKVVNKDFERVHNRLDSLAPAVAEIRGELKHISQTQKQILGLLMDGKESK